MSKYLDDESSIEESLSIGTKRVNLIMISVLAATSIPHTKK